MRARVWTERYRWGLGFHVHLAHWSQDILSSRLSLTIGPVHLLVRL